MQTAASEHVHVTREYVDTFCNKVLPSLEQPKAAIDFKWDCKEPHIYKGMGAHAPVHSVNLLPKIDPKVIKAALAEVPQCLRIGVNASPDEATEIIHDAHFFDEMMVKFHNFWKYVSFLCIIQFLI